MKIDLDLGMSKRWLTLYRDHIRLVLIAWKLTATAIRITASRRKGYHVRIYLNKDVNDSTANLLQFLLCDDHDRVNFNQARINLGYKGWNKLFEKAPR